jgi:prepilin peptidase CpaA
MVTVIIADVTRYIIPNWLVGVLLLLYPVMVYFSPERPDWKIALLVMLGVFAGGFSMFALKVMGGGDIKLLMATSLWIGFDRLFEFIFWVAIAGGILSVFLLTVRMILFQVFSKRAVKPELPRVLKRGEPAPYGVAIAVTFLAFLWMHKMPGISL